MPDADMPLVSIVVLNYNGKGLLEKFLPSIRNLSYQNKEIIIVDNASSDGSIDFLKNNYPHFKIIINKENLGTAEASNIGARYAQGKYIFFISNDMELDKEILNYMIEKIENDPQVGICTCKMKRITENGEKLDLLDSLGGNIDIFGFPVARGFNEIDRGQFGFFTEVFFSFGGAMLIRKEIFEQLEGYDSKTFTLGDDIDLSWRLRLLGHKVVVEPKAYLYHRVSATLGTLYGRSHKRFLSEKNILRALLKNYSVPSLFLILPLYLLILSGEMVFFLVLGKFSLALSGIKAINENIKELPDILVKRNKIQSQRKINDFIIFRFMKKGSYKIMFFFDFIDNRGKGANWDNYFGE